MAMATAASTSATASTTTASSTTTIAAGVGVGENRKFFCQLGRTAMRASRAFPIAGTDKDFAVALAFLALKFVNRHDYKITGCGKIARAGVTGLVFPF
jgi:hypothetical protein